MRDWVAWHEQYDDPASRLSARLALVKQHLAGALDRAPAGPVRLVSLCAAPLFRFGSASGDRDQPGADLTCYQT